MLNIIYLRFYKLRKTTQGSTFRKKSLGQLASKFSFLVARTSILVAKNYLQEKIAYNILKVFLTSTKSSISYLLQNRLHNPYNGTCYKIHFYVFMYSVTVKWRGTGGREPGRTGGGRGTGDGRRKGGKRDLYDGGKRERNSKR